MPRLPSINRTRLHLAAVLALSLLASGCAVDKEKMRAELRRPVDTAQARPLADNAGYSRTAQNEIYSQFKRLPNPDLVMYVFPHLAGSDPAPIPGYTTVFPLYQRVQYAMPGERVENY